MDGLEQRARRSSTDAQISDEMWADPHLATDLVGLLWQIAAGDAGERDDEPVRRFVRQRQRRRPAAD